MFDVLWTALSQPPPFELQNHGDLLALVWEMVARRGEGTVRITEVKGYVDEDVVQSGQGREVDRIGNDKADGAADFVRRRVDAGVTDARRNLSGVCRRW